MIIALKAKKERLELTLAATLNMIRTGELENWEKIALTAECGEMSDELNHTIGCLAIYEK